MDQLQPPDKLRHTILVSIRRAEQRRARLHFAVSATTLCASLIGFIFSIRHLLQTFYNSEFYSYATLVFSDSDVVIRLWQDIAISLAESLPVLAIIASLVAVGAILVSMRVMVRTISMALTPSFKT